MTLALFLLFITTCANSAPHQPVDLQKCSLMKFDLSDLDNSLHTYKKCLLLGDSLPPKVQSKYRNRIHQKMDTAWKEVPAFSLDSTVHKAMRCSSKMGLRPEDVRIFRNSHGQFLPFRENECGERDKAELVIMFSAWWLIFLILVICVLTYLTFLMLKAICTIMHRTTERLRY